MNRYNIFNMWHIAILLIAPLFHGVAARADINRAETQFPLQHREHGFSLEVNIPLEGTDFIFRQEPDFGKRSIVRGVIPVGQTPDDFMGFAWDETESKLYLDLNRNLDLTDDTDGVFSASGQSWHQTFNGITIHGAINGMTVPYNVEFSFFKWPGTFYCTMTINSGWEGVIELHDRNWLMGFADNMDGVLDEGDIFVLRPADADIDENAMNRFPAATRLFLAERLYHLATGPGGVPPDINMQFTELAEPVATVKLQGERLDRLVVSGPQLAIVDNPGEYFSLPAGYYTHARAYMNGGPGIGIYESKLPDIHVTPEGPNHLRAGGPLHHIANIRRFGSLLRMDYRLQGVGGENYTALDNSTLDNPRVEVMRDGEQVASGSFEYG